MAFIQCDCQTVYDSARAVYPGCGRCPSCGQQRVQTTSFCPNCALPYCRCCGRCPGGGALQYADIEPCECGHPVNLDVRASVEKAWPICKSG